jgi:hypothetical protein
MAKSRRKVDAKLTAWVNNGGSIYCQRLAPQNMADKTTTRKYKSLTDTWNAVTRLTASKKALAKARMPKYCRVLEESLTINGWYPHFHLIWQFDSQVTNKDAGVFLDSITNAWVKASGKIIGSNASVSEQYSDYKNLMSETAHWSTTCSSMAFTI